MANCPVCRSQVNEKANFCSECGNQLASATFDRARIVAMQERIKSVRQNDVTYNLVTIVGIIIAVTFPFVMRFVLHYTMDFLSWVLTGAGILLFVGGFVGLWFDNNKVKDLIEQLERGQK